MECKFVIGQEVVCCASGDWTRTKIEAHNAGYINVNVPVRGHVYTIREIYIDPWDGKVGIRLCEVVNVEWRFVDQHGRIFEMEIGWVPSDFAPIVRRDLKAIFKMRQPVDA